jgi:hypothetical protein
VQALRAKLPQQPVLRGRSASNAGAPVRNPGPAIQFSLGIPNPGWSAGDPYPGWATGIPYLEWTVGYTTIGMNHLSTQYYPVPVAASKAGVSYNPTGDTVQMAFMPTPTQVPGNSDWASASWETDTSNIIYPYSAKVLVGPNGVITLGIGMYIVYVKITDNPETPVDIAGQLQIS